MRKKLFGHPGKRKAICKGRAQRRRLRYYKKWYPMPYAEFQANFDARMEIIQRGLNKMVQKILRVWGV